MSRSGCCGGISPLRTVLLLPAAAWIAHGQVAPAPPSKLALKAELVLTVELCATKIKKGSSLTGKETFAVGKRACPEIEQELRKAFSSLMRVATEPAPGTTSAQLVLIPKFVDVAIAPSQTRGKRDLVVLLEWTVKDRAGEPVWIETVQGSAKRKYENDLDFNPLHNLSPLPRGPQNRRILEDAVKDLARTSAKKMSEAPELRKLMQ